LFPSLRYINAAKKDDGGKPQICLPGALLLRKKLTAGYPGLPGGMEFAERAVVQHLISNR